MDHTNHVRLSESELTSDLVDGAIIYDAYDHKIGDVSHVHLLAGGGRVVVDVGGFLGTGSKPVAMPLSQIDFMRDENGDVHAMTNWTKDELKDQPEHKDMN